jgi:hypothetical protein
MLSANAILHPRALASSRGPRMHACHHSSHFTNNAVETNILKINSDLEFILKISNRAGCHSEVLINKLYLLRFGLGFSSPAMPDVLK